LKGREKSLCEPAVGPIFNELQGYLSPALDERQFDVRRESNNQRPLARAVPRVATPGVARAAYLKPAPRRAHVQPAQNKGARKKRDAGTSVA